MIQRPETEVVAALIREAAISAVMPRFNLGRELLCEKKGDGSPVTMADKEAERIITDGLKDIAPGYDSILGEEEAEHQGMSVQEIQAAGAGMQYGWTIDPLDGTNAFSKGSPHFSMMVSETYGGHLQRGWIYLPVTQDMFYAEVLGPQDKDRRAYLNGERLLPGLSPHQRVRGVAYDSPNSSNSSAFLCGRGSGSVGVDYTHLARGLVDFVAHREPKPWDHFPGSVLVNALGGRMALSNEQPYPSNQPTHGSKVLTATDPAVWGLAAQYLYTAYGAFGLEKQAECKCRLGTGVVSPDCQNHN